MSLITLALITALLPAGIALLLMVVPALRRSGKPAALLSIAGAFASFGAAVMILMRAGDEAVTASVPWILDSGQSVANIGVHIDGISATMLVVVSFVALCVQVFSWEYMNTETNADFGRYFTWQSLFLFSMQSLVIAPNILQLFLAWELVGLCSYLLIGFYYKKPSAARAALKAFWMTKFADIGLLIGLLIQYTAIGNFDFGPEAAQSLAAVGGTTTALVVGGYFLAVMGKSAQFPLHIWLPDAMEGPTPVSALLHAATMVAAGVFLVVRAYPLFEAAPGVMLFMAMIGGFTALFAAIVAMVQTDIKKVLAYSTCSQLGFMVAALGTGSVLGGYFHLTTHAFFKALLFLGAGAAIHAVHSNSIHDMGGLVKKIPISAAMFIIGAAALAGIPGLSGFFSKDIILEEMVHAGHWLPLGLLLVAAALTAFYMTRVVVIAFFGKASTAAMHSTPLLMGAPMAALTVMAMVTGYTGATLGPLWGGEIAFHVAPIGIAATSVALAGVVYGLLLYGRGMAGPSFTKLSAFILSGPVDAFWIGTWRRATLPVAKSVAWTDRYIVDGAINGIGWLILSAGDAIRKLQTGRAQDYAMAVIVGVLFFVIYGAVGG